MQSVDSYLPISQKPGSWHVTNDFQNLAADVAFRQRSALEFTQFNQTRSGVRRTWSTSYLNTNEL